jgi:hypothetical protein
MYDHYVSLGRNCEVAFQFRRVLSKDQSSFFSWNITSLDALISILGSDFRGVLQEENLRPYGRGDLVLDVSHGYCFHSPFSKSTPTEDPLFRDKFDKLKEKTDYLIKKFHRVAEHAGRVAYFYKTEDSHPKGKLLTVRDMLRDYHKGRENFILISLETEAFREEDWAEVCIANRYLRRFAPDEDAVDGHLQSYDKVFREFPHVEGLLFSTY